MDVPYFIIENISDSLNAIARRNGFTATHQENWRTGTYYSFQQPNGANVGHLFVSEPEFKRAWLLDEKNRTKYLEGRMLGDAELENSTTFNPSGRALREDHLVDFARAVSMKLAPSAKAFSVTRDQHGRDWVVRLRFGDHEIDVLELPQARRNRLLATNPLERYKEIENAIRSKIASIANC